ncbi:DUF4222 domain-containing protein [Enterobacter hormaechei]|nr:DUF4222 domain-containing protein [Enterobacter hormaechei]
MVRKNSGLAASGQTQPRIRPGDIWKDRHGSRIIILAVSPLSVEYRRIGYDATCTSSPARFIRDFLYLEGKVNESDVSRFMAAADGNEKIRVLREIIQERLKK